jgi:hypothetical protein
MLGENTLVGFQVQTMFRQRKPEKELRQEKKRSWKNENQHRSFNRHEA